MDHRLLPVELYRPIAEQVRKRKDLYNLLFVSQDFLFEAERLLYYDIVVKKESTLIQILWTITSCRRKASLIHNLSVSWTFQPIDHQAIPAGPFFSFEKKSVPLRVYKTFTIVTPYSYIRNAAQPIFPRPSDKAIRAGDTRWNSLHVALAGMCNLKNLHLVIRGDIVDHLSSIQQAFSCCTFKLRSLTIMMTERRLSHAFVRPHWRMLNPEFVNRQTDLVQLDFRSVPLTIAQDAFPKLTILVVSDSNTAQFINRPTIRAVHLLESRILHISSCPVFSHIRSLRFTYPGGALVELIQKFPSLRFLRIDYLAFPERRDGIAPVDLQPIFTALTHLINLEQLSLHLVPRLIDGVICMLEKKSEELNSLQVVTLEGWCTEVGTRSRLGTLEGRCTEVETRSRLVTFEGWCTEAKTRFRWVRVAPGSTFVEEQIEEEWSDSRWHQVAS